MKRFFPNSLITLPVWLLWNLELNDKGKLTKVPYSGNYEGRASSTDAETWCSFEQAKNTFLNNRDKYSGIGIAISKQYHIVFVDVDHCLDENGIPDERGTEVLKLCQNTFVEKSQSGRGLHAFMEGTLEKSFNNRPLGVEMYDSGKFCAMTGDAIFKNEIVENQEALSSLFNKYKTPDRQITNGASRIGCVSLEDADIIRKANQRGKRFPSLYSGDWQSAGYGSQSEADEGLCMILAFWCDRDFEAIDRIFRSSGLYRDKWERADYRRNTIERACANISETLSEFKLRKRREEERAFIEGW